jgi:hypothetical protein
MRALNSKNRLLTLRISSSNLPAGQSAWALPNPVMLVWAMVRKMQSF